MAEPFPICYLNGEYQKLRDARVSPLDRAFLFGDSVYEVLPAFGGRMFRFREHFDRLARSLNEIRLPSPHTHAQWLGILDDLIRRNGGGDMYIYGQVTPGVFAMASPLPTLTDELRATGLAAITVEDFRWGRCDIKTTALLANVLMRQRAADADAQEAILVRDGDVLEGSSTSVFVVSKGVIATPPNSSRILPGTTRDVTLELAEGEMPVTVRRIGIDELRTADEVWISSATRDVMPITRIDGRPVGTGKPGPLWQRMNESFKALRERLAGTPAL